MDIKQVSSPLSSATRKSLVNGKCWSSDGLRQAILSGGEKRIVEVEMKKYPILLFAMGVLVLFLCAVGTIIVGETRFYCPQKDIPVAPANPTRPNWLNLTFIGDVKDASYETYGNPLLGSTVIFWQLNSSIDGSKSLVRVYYPGHFQCDRTIRLTWFEGGKVQNLQITNFRDTLFLTRTIVRDGKKITEAVVWAFAQVNVAAWYDED